MQTTYGSTTTTPTTSRDAMHTLDTLARRTHDELDALYRAATVPATMYAADGALVGRMLAVRGMPSGIAGPLRRWAASASFVWEGKTFAASSDTRGIGNNRVYVPGVFGRQNLFPFDTTFGPSALDGRPTLILDYDLEPNPPWIRRVHDEIRGIARVVPRPGDVEGRGHEEDAGTVVRAGLEAVVTKPGAPGHIVITGAAGAIGAALARAMRGAWPVATLTLVDRVDTEALACELGSAGSYIADLADVDSLPRLVARIEHDGGLIDGLVNCAGVMRVQNVASWKWDDASTLLAIDLLAPLRLIDLLVPGMAERRTGLVVNVSSMAGRVPLRGCAYYGAAKAGLAMASEIARADLADRGVSVITVYPGPVRSALEAGARAEYGGGGLFGRFAPTGDPTELAERVMEAIAAGEPRVIYPRLYGLGWTAPNVSRWFALAYGPPPVS